jgi:hypothetical protein
MQLTTTQAAAAKWGLIVYLVGYGVTLGITWRQYQTFFEGNAAQKRVDISKWECSYYGLLRAILRSLNWPRRLYEASRGKTVSGV